MHIVIADQLPCLRRRTAVAPSPDGPSTPDPAATPDELGPRSRRRRRAHRSQRDEGNGSADRRSAEASGDCPRRHRRRQRRRRGRERARHPRHERARRQQRQRRRARAGADAVAGARGAGRRRGDEAGRVGQEEARRARSCAARRSASSASAASARKSRRARARSAWRWSRTIRSSPSKSPTRSASGCSSLDGVCADADYISLHIPATPETRHLFGKDAPGPLQEGRAHRQHGARRADRRGGARPTRSSPATSRGAALDVFETEPPADWRARAAAAGRRDAAHRRVDRRSAGARRPRDRDCRARLPDGRRDQERGQLPRRRRRGRCSSSSRT